MYETKRKMAIIKALDPTARLAYSDYTDKFYVEALGIDIGDGCILSGVTVHDKDKDMAIEGFFERITNIPEGCFIVAKYNGKRREWKWNGFAFYETTRKDFL